MTASSPLPRYSITLGDEANAFVGQPASPLSQSREPSDGSLRGFVDPYCLSITPSVFPAKVAALPIDTVVHDQPSMFVREHIEGNRMEHSFNKNGNFLPRNRLNRPYTKADIHREGAPVFQAAISNDNEKIVANRLEVSPRHVRNLKTGDCVGTSWPVFIMAAMDNPELRSLVGKWLDLVPRDQVAALDLAERIKKFAATLPEAGDQIGG